MADLAVTAHRHAAVAAGSRAGSNDSDPGAAMISSFEQLLQGGIIPRRSLPPAADGLRVEREAPDREDRAAGRPVHESMRPITKRIEAKPAQTIEGSRHSDAMRPMRGEADRDRAPRADRDSAEVSDNRPNERLDRRKTRPFADPAEETMPPPEAAGAQPAVVWVQVNAAAQSAGPAAQICATAAAPGTGWTPFDGAADSAELQHATPAPAPGQAAASVTRDADMLISQPGAALAPAAVVAAESLQGQGVRLRPNSSGPAAGAALEPQPAAAGVSEAAADPGMDVSAMPGVAARAAGGLQTAQATAGTAVAGGANAAAGDGVNAGQGQLEPGQRSGGGSAATVMTAATGVSAAPPGKSGGAPSAGSAVDTRGLTGIGEGSAIGGIQAPQQAGRAAGAPAVPQEVSIQQRMISDQISVHIRKAVHEGTDRIEIRLKPEAFGRVDVRLEMGADNRVVATVTADQRHTLELLRADARSLERALQEAGLQTDSGSLNFNLRSGDDGRPGQHDGRPTSSSLHDAIAADGQPGPESAPQAYGRPEGRPDGIDIRA